MNGFKSKSWLMGCLGILLMLFQNCSQTRFAVDGYQEAPSESLSGPSDAPLPPIDGVPVAPAVASLPDGDPALSAPPEEGDPKQAYSGPCQIFKDQTLPLLIPDSAEIISVERKLGSYKIGAAKSVSIKDVAGSVSVESAQTVSAEKVLGRLVISKANEISRISEAVVGVQANANRIDQVSNLVGLTCLHAGEMGNIERVVSGTKIIAAKIQKISNFVGVVRVYGAEIEEVGNFVGHLCLYNGAKVLRSSNVVGYIRKCD
jgi:hypothetical protein